MSRGTAGRTCETMGAMQDCATNSLQLQLEMLLSAFSLRQRLRDVESHDDDCRIVRFGDFASSFQNRVGSGLDLHARSCNLGDQRHHRVRPTCKRWHLGWQMPSLAIRTNPVSSLISKIAASAEQTCQLLAGLPIQFPEVSLDLQLPVSHTHSWLMHSWKWMRS